MERPKPPAQLREAVLSSIRTAERKSARRSLAVSILVAGLSLGGLAYSALYLVGVLHASGSYSYVSLVFSDPDIILDYWQYVALSFVESAPVAAIIAILSAVWLTLASARAVARNARGAFNFA